MAKATYRAEQIIPMLREAEVEIGKGMSVREVCRKLGIHKHTYYHWRRENGGPKSDQLKRLIEFELKNCRLRRLSLSRMSAIVWGQTYSKGMMQASQ
ncbi:transposase [bacterium]|nr:transposase [bacterium]MBU1984517.1 transposase [bacterium]